ncbi:hypothetical protein PTKIN_Ptkin01aG0343100 [Pterospermum kingtungense]
MASRIEYFRHSGPSNLTSVDWNNADHRRCVAASLVQGVSMLERDRQAGLAGSYSRAPLWWEFFEFKLFLQLVDDDDRSIFGAIFKHKPKGSAFRGRPSYVIAFRGTLLRPHSLLKDLELDMGIVRNELHQDTRFRNAMKAVRERVASVGNSNLIWLTGHSLGAAIAMLAGKTMAKEGKFLEAFLFNPPFPAIPIESMIKNKNVKIGLRVVGTVVKVALAGGTNGNNENERNEHEDSFAAISGWIPCLFVNKEDKFCCEYIGYFEHRKRLEAIGARDVANLTSRYSLENICMNAAGTKSVGTSEPLHLLPSANLTVNQSRSVHFTDHDLCQWWRTDLNLRRNVYKYK